MTNGTLRLFRDLPTLVGRAHYMRRIKATLDLNPFAADSLLLRRGGRLPRWRVALRFLSIQKIPSWDVMSKTGTDDLIGYRKAFPTADFDKCYSDR